MSIRLYPCRLTALGPVFIGKGSELSKKEYLFLDGRKTAGVVDIEKLYGAAVRNGLGKHFETYMMDPRDKRNLGQWVREEGLSGQEVRSCLKYAVDSGDTVIQRGTPVQIVECIKDPYGLPYIPGSSIKGMLRTVLLAGRILKDPGKFDRDREQALKTVRNTYGKVKRTTFLQAERRSVEQNGFYSLNRNERRREDAVNDELSEIGAQIPAEDRFEGGVLAIDMPSGVYFEIEAIPDFPFAAYHSIHSTQYVPEMMEMIVDYIETDATWVLVNDAPYEHKDVTPIYEFAEFDEALKESNFQIREDLSVEGLVMVYERV